MWSFRAWQRKRILARNPVDADLWQRVLDSLPILDGLGDDELARLRERAVLFLHDKRLTALPGVELQAEDLRRNRDLLIAITAERTDSWLTPSRAAT